MDGREPGRRRQLAGIRQTLAAREPRNPVEALAGLAGDDDSPLRYLAENVELLMRLGINVFYLLPPYRIGQAARKGVP